MRLSSIAALLAVSVLALSSSVDALTIRHLKNKKTPVATDAPTVAPTQAALSSAEIAASAVQQASTASTLANEVSDKIEFSNELELTNLAVNKPITMSSLYGQFKAEFANDGNHETFAHTDSEPGPSWIELDLTSPSEIRRITVWNRADSGQKAIRPFRVIIFDAAHKVIGSHDFTDEAQVYAWEDIFKAHVQFVRVELLRKQYLHPAEIEVFGWTDSDRASYEASRKAETDARIREALSEKAELEKEIEHIRSQGETEVEDVIVESDQALARKRAEFKRREKDLEKRITKGEQEVEDKKERIDDLHDELEERMFSLGKAIRDHRRKMEEDERRINDGLERFERETRETRARSDADARELRERADQEAAETRARAALEANLAMSAASTKAEIDQARAGAMQRQTALSQTDQARRAEQAKQERARQIKLQAEEQAKRTRIDLDAATTRDGNNKELRSLVNKRDSEERNFRGMREQLEREIKEVQVTLEKTEAEVETLPDELADAERELDDHKQNQIKTIQERNQEEVNEAASRLDKFVAEQAERVKVEEADHAAELEKLNRAVNDMKVAEDRDSRDLVARMSNPVNLEDFPLIRDTPPAPAIADEVPSALPPPPAIESMEESLVSESGVAGERVAKAVEEHEEEEEDSSRCCAPCPPNHPTCVCKNPCTDIDSSNANSGNNMFGGLQGPAIVLHLPNLGGPAPAAPVAATPDAPAEPANVPHAPRIVHILPISLNADGEGQAQ